MNEAAPRARWIYRLPLILFAALALLFFVRLYAGDPSRLPSALIGRDAPETSLAALEGPRRDGADVPGFSTAALKGKLVVLNVFASWCGPCREEHPFLMQIAASPPFASGQSVMAGLNHKDDAENARRFLGTYGNPYSAVGVDRNGRASIDWGVYGVPETFVVDAGGKIILKHVGPLDASSAGKVMALVEKAIGRQ